MIDTKELRAVILEIGLNGICLAEISELLDRLEAAESELLEEARLNGMGSEREAALMAKLEAAEKERDALRAKIEAKEKQEPVGTLHDDGCFVWRETAPHQSNYAGWKMALYAHPGAQPAPSAPDGWKLVPIEPTQEMSEAGVFAGSTYYDVAEATYEAMLAAAPEAKP